MGVVPEAILDEAARLFALLSDPTRLRIVSALHDEEELPVQVLAARTGSSVANASQHLNRLAAGGIVARRRQGKSVLYRIADERIGQLCEIVCSSVRDRARLILEEGRR
jgi:DNA-binding transcriptional ArsR family regulator